MKKISIFVDVQNIYYTTRSIYRRNFDYNKFWGEVTKGREVVTAKAYAIDRGDKKQIEFQNILRAIGFEVKLQPFISRSDGSSKGDWDVGIAIDVMEFASKSDIVVLASGDGDFGLLLRHIRVNFNTVTEVYGVPELTSEGLRSEATTFNAIDDKFLLR